MELVPLKHVENSLCVFFCQTFTTTSDTIDSTVLYSVATLSSFKIMSEIFMAAEEVSHYTNFSDQKLFSKSQNILETWQECLNQETS